MKLGEGVDTHFEDFCLVGLGNQVLLLVATVKFGFCTSANQVSTLLRRGEGKADRQTDYMVHCYRSCFAC